MMLTIILGLLTTLCAVAGLHWLIWWTFWR